MPTVYYPLNGHVYMYQPPGLWVEITKAEGDLYAAAGALALHFDTDESWARVANRLNKAYGDPTPLVPT